MFYLWNVQTTHLKDIWVCDVLGMDFLGFRMARTFIYQTSWRPRCFMLGRFFPSMKYNYIFVICLWNFFQLSAIAIVYLRWDKIHLVSCCGMRKNQWKATPSMWLVTCRVNLYVLSYFSIDGSIVKSFWYSFKI